MDEKYLKQLRYVYIDSYASDADVKLYDEKKAKLSAKKPKSVVFCDNLFSLSDEEMIKYLLSKKVSVNDLKKLFDNYKVNNGKFSSLTDKFLEKYDEYITNLKSSKKEDRKISSLMNARNKIDKMIDLGFYSFKEYSRVFFGNTSDRNNKNYDELRRCRTIIAKNDIDEWELIYIKEMEENYKLSVKIMKDRIKMFNGLLKLYYAGEIDLDIIDYYLLIGAPLRTYRGLCNSFVGSSDMVNINRFIDEYDDYDNDLYHKSVAECPDVINGHVITDIDEEKVFNFLYQYSIPFGFYKHAMYKYVNGGLSEYIDVKVKRISK